MRANSSVGGRTRVAMAVTASVVALLTILSPGLASAHSATGTMTVTKFEQVAPNRVSLQVGLIFEGDEHLAQDATVTATLKSAGGESVGPVTLTKAEGDTSLYGAEIDVTGPGQWTAEVTSTNPSATATASVDVAAPQTTTTTTVAETTTSAAPESTAVPGGPADKTDSTTGTGTNDSADKSDDSDNTALYVGLAALAVVIVAGFALVLNKRSGNESDGSDQSSGSGGRSGDQDGGTGGGSGGGAPSGN